MGADFLLACAPVRSADEWAEIWGKLKHEMSAEDINYLAYDQLGEWDCDDPLQVIEDALPEAIERCTDEWRDVSTINLGTGWYYVTGGMSGGDSPTDCFDQMCLLASLDNMFRA
jgi:hypothetical protein